MDVTDLETLHPRLFHMADANSWDGIRTHGLLSTSALLDLFEVEEPRRSSIESDRRPEAVQLNHARHGVVTIRDNKPMTTPALEKCLQDGMTPTDWYRNLNRRVFFWLTAERVETLLEARAYRGRPHLVLTLDTSSLLRAHLPRISLSPINSGATLYSPKPRGAATFRSVAAYPWDEYRRRRAAKDAIVELTVDEGVTDIMQHLIAAHLRNPDGSVEDLQ